MPQKQVAIIELKSQSFEAGPFPNRKAAEPHLDRLFSNVTASDLREFAIVSLGPIPARGSTFGNREWT